MFNSGLSGNIFRIVLYGIGLGSVSMLIYTAGPFIEIGGWRPLENYIIREIVILVLVAAVGSLSGWKFWERKKKEKALADNLSAEDKVEDDTEVLGVRLKDALATLKQSSGGKTNFLYDLPWYIIIGPPGSGKTTALVNSGLKFPLSGGAKPAAAVGSGGTRYCDWWFTEDAVLIDTAGRYTTQDSDPKIDKQSWLTFLDMLKKNRPQQPINGALVAISLEDLIKLSEEELAAHANAIRKRLLEMHERLKIDFPVYALFTKGDLVAGFLEYFGNLGEQGRRVVWGATFQTDDKKRNLVSEVPTEFDALIERLNQEMPDRLQEEPAPATRVSLYGFPAQMAKLERPLHDFLNAIFEPTRYHASANLRGFYFTSGTQQGTPIDQLINALVKNFGAQEVSASLYSGLGKSFFLHDLIRKVIIGEAAWVSTDPRAVRRAILLKAAAFIFIFAASAAMAGAWWTSYTRNEALISASDAAAKEYAAAAGPLAHEDVVGDRDFGKILPLLQKLRYAPTGYAYRETPVPLAATFGLSQWERLESSSESAYRLGLERLLRPRLLYRLEEVLDQHRNDPSYVYEALKVYMMLGGLRQPIDRDLILAWERQDWAENLLPGVSPGLIQSRQALEEHLAAMLDLSSDRTPLVETSATVLEDSQKTLARLSLKQRAYELLKSQARTLNIPDWVAAKAVTPDFDRVFEVVGGGDIDTIRVPGFYTYAGFQRGFIDRLPGIADRINKERWVLGASADQTSVDDQYRTLATDLLNLYNTDFLTAWRSAFAKMQLKRLTTDKPRYATLAIASAANSPIKSLFESIRNETSLTKERPANPGATPPAGQTQPGQPPQQDVNLFPNLGEPPGARIEAQFRPFTEWVDASGGRRPIDDLLGQLSEIAKNLTDSATVPSQAAQSNLQLAPQVQRFRATASRLPDPFKDMMLKAADAFQSDVNNSELGLLAKALGDKVTGACNQVVNGRYPFTRGASNEISLADFGRVFAQGGIMDSFFQQYLQKYADTSKPSNWTWRASEPLTQRMSLDTLKQFQRADQIRTAFFAGGNLPSFSVTVTPPVLSGTGVTAKLEVNGASVTTQAGTSVSPQAILWPGTAAIGRSAITLTYDPQPGTPPGTPTPAPTILEKTGAWSFFRLLDAGGANQSGNQLLASFIVAARTLEYKFVMGTTLNPYTLPALHDFRCPSSI